MASQTSSTTATASPHTSAAESPLPEEIQELEKELSRRLENQEPVAWQLAHLGPFYQQWVWKTRTKKPIRFFYNEFLEKGTYSHCFVVLVVYFPIFTYYWSNVSPSLSLSDRAAFWALGILCWPLIEYCMHRFLFHMNTSSFYMNIVHFCLHGQHHVCVCDPLRLVFPPHVAFAFSIPFTIVTNRLLGWDRGLCWCIGAGNGFVMYDMCHHALHHSHFRFLQRLRLRHLTHHYGQRDKYFGVSHEFTDEWFGTGGWGKKELNQAREYEKNQ